VTWVGFLAFLEARFSVIGVRSVSRFAADRPECSFTPLPNTTSDPRLQVKVLDGVFGGKAESWDQS
jgi:hypothetical protein